MFERFFPGLRWLPGYTRASLRDDLVSGITVAFLLIPQGMAYAMVAGLPAIFGLYATVIPPVIYALLGTSNKISIGPVALDSILIITGLSMLADSGTGEYVELAILLTLMVGLIQAVFGLAKMGFIANFLSYPVIVGYISAAAISITISQFENLLGVEMEGQNALEMLLSLLSSFQRWNLVVLTLGSIAVVLLFLGKRIKKQLPWPLMLMIASMFLAGVFDISAYGIATVQELPSGFPPFGLPVVTLERVVSLLPLAFTVALMGYVGTMSICKSVESPADKITAAPSQELVAVGFANTLGGLFHAFPVSASFSRSAVFRDSGARTPYSMIFSAVFILLVLLFFTPLFNAFPIPKLVLSAIVVASVLGLIDWRGMLALAQAERTEFAICMVTFMATLLINIQVGLLVGVALSIFMVIHQAASPHMTELGAIDDGSLYRNITRFPDARVRDDVLLFRFDAPLFFANKDLFVSGLNERLKQRNLNELDYILIEAESINSVDVSGLLMLQQLEQRLTADDVKLCLVGAIGPVRDAIRKQGIDCLVSETRMFTSIGDAMDYIDKGRVTHRAAALQTNVGAS